MESRCGPTTYRLAFILWWYKFFRMAAPTPAEMVELLTQALADAPGVKVIVYADGRRLEYDREAALKELSYWNAIADAESRQGLVMSRMSLKGDA